MPTSTFVFFASCKCFLTVCLSFVSQLFSRESYESELFERLRVLGLEQGVVEFQPDGSTQRTRARGLQYKFLGYFVCRDAFCRLYGVGEIPRLFNIYDAAIVKGLRTCPMDGRFIKKLKSTCQISDQLSDAHGQIYSYIMSLYDSVAETLPEDQWGEIPGMEKKKDSLKNEEAEEAEESMKLLEVVPATALDATESSIDTVRKFLPPGSIFDCFRQYTALGHPGSFGLFLKIWKRQFPHLLFRSTHQHSVCPVCVKHKLLLKVLSGDMSAFVKQQFLYSRHLQMQYVDRTVYWKARADSRKERSNKLVLICDAMDQQKFAWPRGSFLKSHDFDRFNRPRLHLLAVIAHGHGLYFGLSHMDTSKGASNTLDFLSYVLTDLYRQGVKVADMWLHLQLDNAASSNKNNAMLLWGAALTHGRLIARFTACFLRVGHTHEDPGWKSSFALHSSTHDQITGCSKQRNNKGKVVLDSNVQKITTRAGQS